MKFLISTALIFLFISYNASGIIIRHDVEDRKYRELGEEYSASMAYVGGCAATLIAPNWLLTAAHCVAGKEERLFFVKHMEDKYRIERVIAHPKFNSQQDEIFDLALVQLKDPVKDGSPVKLYSKTNETGKPVIFVGRGSFGNGISGPVAEDFVQRGATNTVLNVSEHVIGFKFNEPEQATEMEGISSRGDSGGPAFIMLDNQLYVAGISAYQVKNGHKEGSYGVMEYYTRVSTHFNWLGSLINKSRPAKIAQHPAIEAIKQNDKIMLLKAMDKEFLQTKFILNEAFYQTVMLNRGELAGALIKSGADINRVTINEMSLFEFSLMYGSKEYFDMLLNEPSLSQTYYHNKESKVLPLLISKFRKDDKLLERVKQVIKQGASINAKNRSGDTALILAGWLTNDLKLVSYLIEHGSDINSFNNNGDTPLMDAAFLGKTEILKLLLEAGADQSLKNKRGKTALDLARNKNNKEAVKLLVFYDKNSPSV